MSEGPIERERAAWLPASVSTTNAARVCAKAPEGWKSYCGRRTATLALRPEDVNCADCAAAIRADAETVR